MPIREHKLLDKETKKPIINETTGEPIMVPEKFPAHFLGDSDVEALDTLNTYGSDVDMLANRYHMLTGVDKDDLKSEGVIGLARAKRDFETERSKTFRIFAIYKIKEAMREYVSTQSTNVRAPQYIQDAHSIIKKIKGIMEKSGEVKFNSLTDIWEASEIYDSNAHLVKDVQSLRGSLKSLAERSCTSVHQLLDRADMIPGTELEIVDGNPTNLYVDQADEEDDFLSKLSLEKCMNAIKSILTAEEFNLLHQRYVEGKTVRELEDMFGIKAASIVVKTNLIRERLLRHKDKILCHESDTDN